MKKGFTLIELLVVISIISLLSSVVLSATGSARVKANNTAINRMVLQYVNALELARLKFNPLPPSSVACLGIGHSGARCGLCTSPGVGCSTAESSAGTIDLKAKLSESLPSFPPVTTKIFPAYTNGATQIYWIGAFISPNYATQSGDYPGGGVGHLITWGLEGTNQECARFPGSVYYDRSGNYQNDNQSTICQYVIMK